MKKAHSTWHFLVSFISEHKASKKADSGETFQTSQAIKILNTFFGQQLISAVFERPESFSFFDS